MSHSDTLHFNINGQVILKYVRKFFYSNYYFITLLAMSFLPWLFGKTLVGLYLIMSLGTISLIVNKDITPSLFSIPLMLVTTSTEDFLAYPENYNSLIVAAVLFSIGLIVNIIIYRQHMKTGRLTMPLIFVSIAMLIGGAGTEYYPALKDHILFVISLGPLMLALYHIAMSCMHMPNDVDHKIYFAKIISLFALIAALQVLVLRLRIEGDFLETLRDALASGWANRNGLACLLLLGMGMVFYIADNAKYANFIWYHVGFAFYLALVFSFSRAGIIFGTIELVAIIAYIFAKGKHRYQFSIVLVMWIIGVSATLISLRQYLAPLLERLEDIGLDSSGRTDLYKEAFELFKTFPIFGVGFGYYGGNLAPSAFCIYWFHDTPLQIMASMGLFGVGVYVWYYLARLKMWIAHINPFTVLAMLSVLGFEGQALLDVGPFSSIPFLYLTVLLEIFGEMSGRMEDEEKKTQFLTHVSSEVEAFNASRA